MPGGGRLACHRHRLLQLANAQLNADGCREERRQVDAIPDYRREARQRKGHAVLAGTKIVQDVRTAPVRDCRADFFNQGRAGRFNRDARQHSPARIAHDTSDSALLPRQRLELQR
jgi:hypothetical protein